MGAKDITFNHYVTWGDNCYGTPNYDRHPVIFDNRRLGVTRTIVDASGNIRDYPGVAHPEVVGHYTRRFGRGRIHFRSTMENLDGSWALVWQVEPEGRYWEDDYGFGATWAVEVSLYARLDELGRFVEPFRIFEIDGNEVHGTSGEEELAASVAAGGDGREELRGEVRPMLRELSDRLAEGEASRVRRLVRGSVMEATLELRACGEGTWEAAALLDKRYASRLLPYGFSGRRSAQDLERYLTTDEAARDVWSMFADGLGREG